MKILLIGPQGSGKSTQADLLAKDLNLPRISTGDIFRELSLQDSEEGRKIKGILNSGKLIDDLETAKIVEQRLNKDDCRKGFILDGYPRNREQQQIFDPKVDKVFDLEVPDDEVIKRLLARDREDDTMETIKKRLSLYHEQTVPLLDYYKNQGILIEIDGMGNIEDIYRRIKDRL
ncbi:MAG: nucleoside monophosphate kinase [Candidatus Daviesbacteria bacterium]|nr:nucleoside monophosphate kinase [Candidatus Daviesbacteria bacterium]